MMGENDLSAWWPAGAALAAALVFAFLMLPGFAREKDRSPDLTIDNAATRSKPAVVRTNFKGTADHDYISQGNFGEFYTAMVLVSDGWTQWPSKAEGSAQGIDGLFVRYDSEKRANFILIVETKTEDAELAKDQMTKTWILGRLGNLAPAYFGPNEKNLAEVIKAVERDSAFVTSELWTHDLDMGLTKREVLDANAKPLRQRPPMPKTASVQLMRALFANLNAFDRRSEYIDPRLK